MRHKTNNDIEIIGLEKYIGEELISYVEKITNNIITDETELVRWCPHCSTPTKDEYGDIKYWIEKERNPPCVVCRKGKKIQGRPKSIKINPKPRLSVATSEEKRLEALEEYKEKFIGEKKLHWIVIDVTADWSNYSPKYGITTCMLLHLEDEFGHPNVVNAYQWVRSHYIKYCPVKSCLHSAYNLKKQNRSELDAAARNSLGKLKNGKIKTSLCLAFNAIALLYLYDRGILNPELDHLIPVSWWNYENETDTAFLLCWRLSNLKFIPSCENQEKSDNYAIMLGHKVTREMLKNLSEQSDKIQRIVAIYRPYLKPELF